MTALTLSSVTVACRDAAALAAFYAGMTGGEVTTGNPRWATAQLPGGRVDFQAVPGYTPPTWPDPAGSPLLHLDFLVDDLAAAAAHVEAAGAVRFARQPNQEHCLVFADPDGHPFCLTTVDELG